MVKRNRKTSQPRTETRKVHFTEKAIPQIIKDNQPKRGRATVLDEDTPGLGILIRSTGKPVYFWYRKIARVPRWRTLADCSTYSLTQARDAAQNWSAAARDWRNSRYDPVKNPFDRVAAAAQAVTLKELLTLYIKLHVRPTFKNPASADKLLHQLAARHWHGMLGLRLNEITKQRVRKVHDDMSGTPRQSNIMLALMRRLHGFAYERSLWGLEDPTRGIKRHKKGEVQRDRWITPEEMPGFLAALDRSKSRTLQDYVRLSLLTGARSANVKSMRWADIRLLPEKATWTIPQSDAKTKSYTINLVPLAVAVLQARWNEHLADATYVFPSSKNKSGHVVDLHDAWIELVKDAGLWDENRLTPHDLRRSAGSYAARRGISLIAIGKMLGHSPNNLASTSIYARLQTEDVRAGLEASVQDMFSLAKPLAALPPAPASKPARKAKHRT
jgi:integrase